MVWKDAEKRRAAIRRHYHQNKQYYLDKNRRRRLQLKKRINEIKESTPCTDCGSRFPYYVMDFDHIEKKSAMISNLMKTNNPGAIEQEIKKCELVCANCHRIRTYDRALIP